MEHVLTMGNLKSKPSLFMPHPIVDYCSVINYDFNVYTFTETWFNLEDNSNLIDLDTYYNIDCIRYGRTGGGTSLFIHSKHNFIRYQT